MHKTSWTMALLVLLAGCGEAPGQTGSESTTEGVGTKKAAPADQPNVVILFADDMGYGDIGSFGHPYNRTPEIDALAGQGQRWTDFYVASPVCSPSRGALLTGRLPIRTGLYGKNIGVYFPNDPGGFPEVEVSLAESLRAVGYRTGIFGKWHLGDAKSAWPTRHGFDEWLGLPYSNDMDWVGEAGIDEIFGLSLAGKQAEVAQALSGRADKYAQPRAQYWRPPLYSSKTSAAGFIDEEVERPAVQTTLTRRYTEAAIDFMKRSGDQPFFVYLPYSMPHTPLFRSPEFEGKSLGGRYGDVIAEIDWSVGQVVRALSDIDVVDNTLVIFTSDNGPWLTMRLEGGNAGLLKQGKGTTYEGGMRVPTVMSWPGQIQPGVVSEIGSTLDIFATVAALAGADGSTAVDGFNLTEVIKNGTPSPRQEMPFYRSGELYAFRLGPWKAHFTTEGAYRQGGERAEHTPAKLYNLLRDPSEKFDLSEQHPDVLEQITAAVARHQQGLVIAPPEFDKRLAKLANQSNQ